MKNAALILAAGKGTRMKSPLPKVLHKLANKELIHHVIDNVTESGVTNINVIIGNEATKVMNSTLTKNVSYSLQSEQLGTGHAVICAKKFLETVEEDVLILAGDTPLIKSSTIKNLLMFHKNNHNVATIVSSLSDNPTGYGRIIRDTKGNVSKITEHKDCTEAELKINEVNSGMYCFKASALLSVLDKLSNNNSQGEYYLTDVIDFMQKANLQVDALAISFKETFGINSPEQLAEAEQLLKTI